MSSVTFNPIQPEKRIIIGLHPFDSIFRSRVYGFLNLDRRNPEHFAYYDALFKEILYQIVDCIVLNYRDYLVLLNHLPHYETMALGQNFPPEVQVVFTDAVKEFGLHVGFAFQPYW